MAPLPPAQPAGPPRPQRLDPRHPRLRPCAGHTGGEATGPNPTDRGKAGTKRHIAVDRQGIPLAAVITVAHVHGAQVLEAALDAIPPVRGLQGRPRRRPATRHADKGDHFPPRRAACRTRGITPRIARRGIESRETFGRCRWVVERTLAWLSCFRRLTVR